MIQKALAYFKEEKGYDRLFSLFKKKYESLGRIGGTVKLQTFEEEELTNIARFLGVTGTELRQKNVLSLEQFEKQLQRTKFEGIYLKELLESYFGEALISRKQQKMAKEQERNQFLEQLAQEYEKLCEWLHYLQWKSPDTYWIHRLIDRSEDDFRFTVHYLYKGFTNLPSHVERLPMFSQRVTNNPHAFDLSELLGKLWLHLLAYHRAKGNAVAVPNESEGINELLLSYNLLRDDITNDVTCVNLLAEAEKEIHPLWKTAAKMNYVMNVPLRELVKLDKIYSKNEQNIVWVVENSGVYSSILDQVPDVPLICTHGQFNYASLLLIDLLVKSDCTIYYAGDLDPEGIKIADRVYQRHPDHVLLWKMDSDAYFQSIADTVVLNEQRLHKLDSCKTPFFAPVIAAMKERKSASYQEALVGAMVEELREWMNY